MDEQQIHNLRSDDNFAADEIGSVLEIDESVFAVDESSVDATIDVDATDTKSEIEKPSERKVPAPRAGQVAFAKVEKSLTSLGFFTPSSRRIKNQKVKRIGFTREIDGKRVEVSAEIHPSGMFGLPVTADQDKYLALQSIITDTLRSDGKITNPIRFKSAELLRLLNTSTKNGNNYKAISEWLDVMSATTIVSNGAVYSAERQRYTRDRFRVFERAVSFGEELKDGTKSDANYVWLSEWQLENINNKFVVPIDLETYRELKNHISKALVPLLQIWLFASHKAEAFEKRYNELCEILTLQMYRAPSQILRQLKPSLDELTHHGYIEKWRIEKTSDRKAYKVVFCHGPKFYRDRRRRLEQKSKAEPLVVIGEFEPENADLSETESHREGACAEAAVIEQSSAPEVPTIPDAQGKLIDDLSARGLIPSTALKLLRSLPAGRIDGICDYIDYWDSVSRGSVVGPGFLYDLIKNGDPLPSSFETQRQRTSRLDRENRRRALEEVEEKLKADYDVYVRQSVDQHIEALPVGQFESRVEAQKIETATESGFWSERPDMAEQFARHAIRGAISKEIGLLSYEQFRDRERPRIAAELNLDLAEVVPAVSAPDGRLAA